MNAYASEYKQKLTTPWDRFAEMKEEKNRYAK